VKQIGWFRDYGSQFAVNFELHLQAPQLSNHLLQTRIIAKLRPLHIVKVGLSATKLNGSYGISETSVPSSPGHSDKSRPSGSAALITYASSSLPILKACASTLLDVLHDRKHAIMCGIERVVGSWTLCQWHVKSTVTNAYRNVVQAALPASRRTSWKL
jgi:hypothetical protein